MPIWLWLLFDLVYAVLFTLLCGGPAALIAWATPWHHWLLAPAYLLAFVVVQALLIACVRMLTPRLVPGSYPLPGSAQARAWLVHFALHRVAHLLAPVYLQFATLRWLVLRALGARVPFDFMCSSDVAILDSSLITIGRGAQLGSGVFITGHFIEDGRIRFAPVSVGARTQVAGRVTLAPGVSIGTGCTIGPGTTLGPGVRIGNDVQVGMRCFLHPGVVVGSGARIDHEANVPKGTHIADGAHFGADTNVRAANGSLVSNS